jgi:hypothetical protein
MLQRTGEDQQSALEEQHRQREEQEHKRQKEAQQQRRADRARDKTLKELSTAQDKARDKIGAIHRDIRIIGDVVLSLSGRLEALEKTQAEDLTHAREAWAQGTTTPCDGAPGADPQGSAE